MKFKPIVLSFILFFPLSSAFAQTHDWNMKRLVFGEKAKEYYEASYQENNPTNSQQIPIQQSYCPDTLVVSAFVKPIGIADKIFNFLHAHYEPSRTGPDYRMIGIGTDCILTQSADKKSYECILDMGEYRDREKGQALSTAFENLPDVLAVRKCFHE